LTSTGEENPCPPLPPKKEGMTDPALFLNLKERRSVEPPNAIETL